MAVSLTHTTVATGTDAGNAQIGKTQWNETHTLTMATDRLLGRTTAGSGAVEEITASTGLTLTAGALAVAKAFPTGDIVGTTDTQNLSNKTFTDNPTFSAGTANGVLYLNGSKALTSGSDLSFDGTALSVIGSAVTPLQVYRYAATGGVIIGQYTASGTSSAPTAVANGRAIGRNNFSGYDGTSFINAAQINAFVDGAVSTGVVYGKIGFNTRGADGLVERAYINSSGNVNIAGLTASKAVFTDASKNLTSTGTLGVDQGGTGLTAGTSGGIPYYSSISTLASSGVLAANALMIGGGAGVAPSTITTGTGVITALGVNTGSAGAFVVNGGALGTPASGTVTNLTGTASININGTVGATTPNTGAFTSVTSTSASGVLTRAAANQDGVHIYGRAGGTGNFEVAITPTTLSADRTLTLPDNSGTVLTTGATVTVAQGGTGATTLTGIVKGNGTSAFTAATAGTDYAAPGSTTTYTVVQNFTASGITLKGSSTGTTTFASANASATNYTITFPASTGTVLTTATAVTVAQGGTGATTLTGVLKGNGTSAFTAAVAGTDYVAPGGALGTPSSGTVTNLTGTASININGTVGATTANTGAFTSITSTSASGILTRAAANQDGVALIGRAGGSSGFEVTLTPTTLTADRTLTLPDNSGTVLTSGAAVTAAQGGTGQTSYAVGDILFASATTTLSKLADVATGNALISGGVGVAPSYGKIGLTTHISGTLAVGNGGTGATTLTGVLKGNGTSAFTAAVAGTDYVIPSGDVASVNGYKCYGGVGTANASGDLVVTFPAAFAATSTTGVAAASTSGNYCVITAISTTSVTIQAQSRSAGTGVASAAIRWVAVGL